MKKRKSWQIFTLCFAVFAVIAGGILFIGVMSGWLSDTSSPSKVVLSPEYQNSETPKMITVTTEEFNALISDKKTFIGITYLPGCSADILSYLKDYATENKINYIYYPWSLLKETWLHESIKYTPSAFIVSDGKLITYLSADSDADTAKYNSYEEFSTWLNQHIRKDTISLL